MGFFKNLYEVATGEPWPWEKKTSEVTEQFSTEKVEKSVKKVADSASVEKMVKGGDGSSTPKEESSSFFSPFNPVSPFCPVNIYALDLGGSSVASKPSSTVVSSSSGDSSSDDDWGGGDDGGDDDWDD